MLIKDFCTATGLSRETVRFYVGRGLLTPRIGAGTGNRYQVFDQEMVERVRLIRAAQALGFTLQKIGKMAQAYEKDGMSGVEKAEVLRARLAEIDQQLTLLNSVRQWMEAKLLWVQRGEVGPPPALQEIAPRLGPITAKTARSRAGKPAAGAR